jgi:hypothetical protein
VNYRSEFKIIISFGMKLTKCWTASSPFFAVPKAVTVSLRAALRPSNFPVDAEVADDAGFADVAACANDLPALLAVELGAIFVVAVWSSVRTESTLCVVSEFDFDFCGRGLGDAVFGRGNLQQPR